VSTLAQPKFLTVPDVARALRVSEWSIYRAVQRGDLPAKRLSPTGAIRIPAAALEEHENRAPGEGWSREGRANAGRVEGRSTPAAPPRTHSEGGTQ
jgi:excisionase family DNA binding protein